MFYRISYKVKYVHFKDKDYNTFSFMTNVKLLPVIILKNSYLNYR